eukprot:993254-Amphidinium_carterae.1
MSICAELGSVPEVLAASDPLIDCEICDALGRAVHLFGFSRLNGEKRSSYHGHFHICPKPGNEDIDFVMLLQAAI